MKKCILFIISTLLLLSCSEKFSENSDRSVISLNKEWKFALGHAYDRALDFNNGTGYFSYMTKAGFGDGPAAKNFDDRMWRTVDVPHDWCVELPFAENGSVSHGSKAIGRNYPENSVGWYRKSFFVDSSDFGKKLSIEFEGVFRNSKVWCNGFYLGEEHSGYTSFAYDLTEYLNYGGENVIAVRADASFEEGWFYEGAGIYRNVNLIITNPLHIARYGTFVSTENISETKAEITSRATIQNESNEDKKFIVIEKIFNADGDEVATKQTKSTLHPHAKTIVYSNYKIRNPQLWEVWDRGEPTLYTSSIAIYNETEKKVVDSYQTHFGIRTIEFDANNGFFLNGRPMKIRGVCNHQDHAGVGVALTPEIQKYRIAKMQEMGVNAIRTSHNPASPDFLEACDRMGMLVLEEVRLIGINQEHQHNVEQLICRDRNHPCIIAWSLGNEEWACEGTEIGARIAQNMQEFANQLDSSRAFTLASSGGWDTGIGKATELCGINYISHGDVPGHHAKFPNQPIIGTEESNTERTRGIYENNDEKCWKARFQVHNDAGMRNAWKFYDSLDWASGLFYWTGFDYRGEPTPFEFPAVISQYGITDLCGFPKDNVYYLQSWWTTDTVLHIASNWNYKQSDSVDIIVYSNCKEVELFINDESAGRKQIKMNDFGEWKVKFIPGTLSAVGYNEKGERVCGENDGKSKGNSLVFTENSATKIAMSAYNNIVPANDVAIINIQALDANENTALSADNTIKFTIDGNAEIIGVGNGNPSCLAPEVFLKRNIISPIQNLRELTVSDISNPKEVAEKYNYSSWIPAFSQEPDVQHWDTYEDSLKVIRGVFNIDKFEDEMKVTLYAKSIVERQNIYVNGHKLATEVARANTLDAIEIPLEYLHLGKNEYAVSGQKFRKTYIYDEPNREPGCIGIVYPAKQTTRNLFNGYAQIIVKPQNSQKVKITAESEGLEKAEIVINE